jgi:hypothetical protein
VCLRVSAQSVPVLQGGAVLEWSGYARVSLSKGLRNEVRYAKGGIRVELT